MFNQRKQGTLTSWHHK